MDEKVSSLVRLSDYIDRYGAVSATETPVVEAYLSRAARIVRDELRAEGLDLMASLRDGLILEDSLADVVCDMVRYAVRQEAEGFAYGSSQATFTGGPYSQTSTFPNPVGSLSFTRVHRRRLGIRRSRFQAIHTLGVTP